VWSEGEVVAVRDVWHGRVWRAVPGVVARDAPEETAVWIPTGTESIYPVDRVGREVRIARPDVEWAARRTPHDALVLVRPGEPWSIWHMWIDGQLDQWYINFEEPLGRRGRALDSRDHKLDLIAYPDGTTKLKDEHELDEAAALGLLDAAAVRADAERALRERPWPTGWETFRPDPEWSAPQLPADWAER
jgi:Protein of unknown function (DUF402)